MKTSTNPNKLRFKSKEESVEIYAKLKSTGKYALFGTCHPATVALLKANGIRPHIHLIKLP